MFAELWFQLKDGKMDFSDKVIDFEIGEMFLKRYAGRERVFDRPAGYYSIVDSRLMFLASDPNFEQTELVYFIFDRHIVKLSIEADTECDYLYQIDIRFRKNPVLILRKLKQEPYDSEIITTLAIKENKHYKIKHEDAYFTTVFNFEVFEDF